MSSELTFGQWLKRRRLGLGLTQEELGRRAGYSGITIRKVEADERRPSHEMAERLAAQLELTAEERAAFIRFARDEGILPTLPTYSVAVPLTATSPPASGVPAPVPITPSSCHPTLPPPLASIIGRTQVVARARTA
jgi:transcriptional regulator with XRE-family HTH domain